MNGAMQKAIEFHLAGEQSAAEAQYRAILRADPYNIGALQNLGLLASETNREEEALKYFQRALKRAPTSGDLWLAVARMMVRLGLLQRATVAFARALALDSNSAAAHYELASTLHTLKRYEGAIAHYRAAIVAGAHEAQVFNNLGVAYRETNQEQEAYEAFGRALEIDPCSAEVQSNMGSILLEKGDLARSVSCFERACALAPDNPIYLHNLTEAKTFTADDPRTYDLLDAASRMTGLNEQGWTHLHFALAKIHDDRGDCAAAATHAASGNALKRRNIAYDEDQTLEDFDRIARAYDTALLHRLSRKGHASRLPIFIVGMPRSGSTLVAQILSSHPAIHGAGETDAFGDQLRAFAQPRYRQASLAPVAAVASQFDGESLSRFGQLYVERLRTFAPNAERIIDKLLINFRCVGAIHLALPQAHIIHVRRNPLDAALSTYFKLFQGEHPYAYDLRELGRFYRAYERLMDHWRRVLPPGAMLEVDYEQIVANFESEARRMLAFCGMPWDPACLEFHTTRRWVKTASAAQVRRPLYASSVGRSASYMDFLAPLIAELRKP